MQSVIDVIGRILSLLKYIKYLLDNIFFISLKSKQNVTFRWCAFVTFC